MRVGVNVNEDFDQEIFIKKHLRHQLNLFRRGWLSESAWKTLLHDQDEDKLYSNMAAFDLRNKCKYLAKAIECTLMMYEDHTFTQCCEAAIQKINLFESSDELEFDDDDNFNQRWLISCPKTIMKWYSWFNVNQCFVKYFKKFPKLCLPPFLDNNPDIRQAIISFCNNNLLHLTIEHVQDYIIKTCLPQLLEKRKNELNDQSLTIEFVKKENGLKSICRQTVDTWIKLLGFTYCERKKTYYCDSHEKPEVVKYRYKYIDRYLEREFRCFRWVQISKSKYEEMLRNEFSIFCGTPYEYENAKGEKYYEFHVDDNQQFTDWKDWPDEESRRFGGCLSVRMPEGAKPLIIFGQDECIFKQYVFCKKTWVGPNGETALTPKDEGHGVMLSSFVSHEYGFDFQLTASQLKAVNKRRQGQLYMDGESAIKKRGNAKKENLLMCPFSKKFEYGNNKEGYWTYEDMVLQLEDCVDVLKTINGDKYDYCFIFDHSNGHDRLRPDGLNVNKISKYFGGKQPHMRNTTIEDESYLGPYNHKHKLKVGDVQSMSWIEDEKGPYYMNTRIAESKKLDKILDEEIEVDLTKDELLASLKAINVHVKGKRDDLVKLCQNNNLPIKRTVVKVDEGWYGKPKGSLQILYERGWIDPKKSHTYYTKAGKKDLYGFVDESTSIDKLMEKQPDFLEQETLLQYYCRQLGVESDRSPKCHPEIAGEGIEFDWGCAKVKYRAQPLSRKRTKDNFFALVDESLGPTVLSISQCRSNARRARLYMLAYKALEHTYQSGSNIECKKELKESVKYNHSLIEKCVNLFRKRRSHRNARDFDKKILKDEVMKGFIVKMCKPEIKCENEKFLE